MKTSSVCCVCYKLFPYALFVDLDIKKSSADCQPESLRNPGKHFVGFVFVKRGKLSVTFYLDLVSELICLLLLMVSVIISWNDTETELLFLWNILACDHHNSLHIRHFYHTIQMKACTKKYFTII